jgi:dihydroorotate dehydrogenase (NAD+) catalytic subunit
MEKISLKTKLGPLTLANPVVVASGTFGSSDEYLSLVDFNRIGAIMTKSVTLNARVGNPSPRIWETSSGMLNAIGLENKGIDHFIANNIPFFRAFKSKLIVSIAGNTLLEYVQIATKLASVKGVDALEINISCPNVKKGGIAFVRDAKQSAKLVEKVRAVFSKPIFVKISPEASDMTALVSALIKGGADGLNMINTIKGMAVDIKTRKARLGNVTGGLSGPAIKPIALRYIYEVKQQFDVPIIGGGGIMSLEDALEFIIVGADAVSLGTANFVNPKISTTIVAGLEEYCVREKIKNLRSLRGSILTSKK